MKDEIILVRKQAESFSVNYPYQLANGGLTRYDWSGTKGGILCERAVPIEVYQWLKDSTTTFTEGELIVKELDKDKEVSEEVEYLVEDMNEEQKDINRAILTRDEIKTMLTKGNHLALKKSLDGLLEGLTEEQERNVKGYIYRTAIDIGVDSNAKRKVLCEWYGSNFEDVGSVFDEEN